VRGRKDNQQRKAEERERQKKEIECFQLVNVTVVPHRAAEADLADRSKHLATQRLRARNSPSAVHRGTLSTSLLADRIILSPDLPVQVLQSFPSLHAAHTLQTAKHPNVMSFPWRGEANHSKVHVQTLISSQN